MVVGVLSALSILSYSKDDETAIENLSMLDVARLPFDAEISARADLVQNRLGIVGALTGDFFINSTIGYASVIFPILLLLWGWVILRKKETNGPITFTNYAVIFAVLSSATVGIANLIFGDVDKEWNGIIGAFVADVMTRLVGKVGASTVVLVVLAITTILAIDLDIQKSLDRVKAFGEDIRARLRQRKDGFSAEADTTRGVMIHKANVDQELVAAYENPLERVEGRHKAWREPEEMEVAEVPMQDEISIEVNEREPGRESENVVHDLLKPPEDEREEIDYVFPSVELLDPPRQNENVDDEELKAKAELVRSKLANFGVEIESVSVTPGPVITLYELVPASGVKISRIVSLADDLALALAAKGIRIMAPIPGKSAVGVEIPNRNPSIVYIRSALNSSKFREAKANLPLAMGKTISGDVYTDDLSRMPHLLIAGSTGSGKSVGINTILASLLFRLHPSEVKFIIIDPKKIELTLYGRLNHHFLAVSPDIDEDIVTTAENAVIVLRSVELEMEKRYDRLAAAGVRNIQDYNDRFKSGRLKNNETITHRKMPYLVVVIDELADLMMTAAREVEEPIARLAQLARAVGIHLVLATQRPSVDVITGVIKANFPARIAYQVASKIDSRTILDMNGAEQLLGNGDMLYLPSGSPKPIRMQNAFISTEEVERLTDHVARQQGFSKPFPLPSLLERKRSSLRGSAGARDEFFEEAARLIVRHQQGSVSLLQRRLKVGYSRAARLVDELEASGIVGPFDGSKAREVLIENEQELESVLRNIG